MSRNLDMSIEDLYSIGLGLKKAPEYKTESIFKDDNDNDSLAIGLENCNNQLEVFDVFNKTENANLCDKITMLTRIQKQFSYNKGLENWCERGIEAEAAAAGAPSNFRGYDYGKLNHKLGENFFIKIIKTICQFFIGLGKMIINAIKSVIDRIKSNKNKKALQDPEVRETIDELLQTTPATPEEVPEEAPVAAAEPETPVETGPSRGQIMKEKGKAALSAGKRQLAKLFQRIKEFDPGFDISTMNLEKINKFNDTASVAIMKIQWCVEDNSGTAYDNSGKYAGVHKVGLSNDEKKEFDKLLDKQKQDPTSLSEAENTKFNKLRDKSNTQIERQTMNQIQNVNDGAIAAARNGQTVNFAFYTDGKHKVLNDVEDAINATCVLVKQITGDTEVPTPPSNAGKGKVAAFLASREYDMKMASLKAKYTWKNDKHPNPVLLKTLYNINLTGKKATKIADMIADVGEYQKYEAMLNSLDNPLRKCAQMAGKLVDQTQKLQQKASTLSNQYSNKNAQGKVTNNLDYAKEKNQLLVKSLKCIQTFTEAINGSLHYVLKLIVTRQELCNTINKIATTGVKQPKQTTQQTTVQKTVSDAKRVSMA